MCLALKLKWWDRIRMPKHYVEYPKEGVKKIIKKYERIATEDIPVYKVLTEDEPGRYVTPYRRCRVYLNEMALPKKSSPIFNISVINQGIPLIERGIHSYTDFETAWFHIHRNDKIFLSYIPKGAKYYIGLDNDVVSDRLYITNEEIQCKK